MSSSNSFLRSPKSGALTAATLIVPLIKEYLEIDVKNDEQLVKVATIIQRALNNTSSAEDGFGLSEADKAQLMSEIEKLDNKSE